MYKPPTYLWEANTIFRAEPARELRPQHGFRQQICGEVFRLYHRYSHGMSPPSRLDTGIFWDIGKGYYQYEEAKLDIMTA